MRISRCSESVRLVECSTLHNYTITNKWTTKPNLKSHSTLLLRSAKDGDLFLARTPGRHTTATPHALTLANQFTFTFWHTHTHGPRSLTRMKRLGLFLGEREVGSRERQRLRHLCLCVCVCMMWGLLLYMLWIGLRVQVLAGGGLRAIRRGGVGWNGGMRAWHGRRYGEWC